MGKAAINGLAALLSAFAILSLIFLYRPIMETSLIRQAAGAEHTTVYLGRIAQISKGKVLRQYFVSPQDALINGIAIYSPQPNRSYTGTVVFKLVRTESEEVVYSWKRNIKHLANNEGLTILRLPPLTTKEGEAFAFELTPNTSPDMMVFMGKGNSYKDGFASVNGKALKTDLAFQVFQKIGPADLWRLLGRRDPNLLGPAPLLTTVFGVWFLLAAFLRFLWTAGRRLDIRAR